MIRVEPCKGCGTLILLGEMMGLTMRCDPAPMDAQEAVAALLAGREVNRVTYVGGRPANLSPARPAVLNALRTAEPGERPMVVGSHRCPQGASAPAYRPNSTPGGTVAPKGGGRPPVPPSRPFSGQATPPSTPDCARDASQTAPRRPSDPPCSTCGLPAPLDVRDRLVITVLGATPVEAVHARC